MKRLAASALITLGLLPGIGFPQESPPLGRLFFSAQERAQLDRQRNNPRAVVETHSGERSLTLNGEVRSSSGRSTHWVNGQAQQGTVPGRPPVPVGDTYQRATGERESLLRGGKIVINPPSRP